MALSAKVKMNLLLTGPSKPLGFPLGTTLLPAVVLTVMVVVPFPVTVAGEKEQVVRAGRPAHENSRS
jgi:hypothetical protein